MQHHYEPIIRPGDTWAPELTVTCPVCAGEYSHIVRVYTRVGPDRAEAGVYRGTVAHDDGVAAWRRSALVIVFDGECDHRWRLVIQQHKGNQHVWVEVLS